MRALTPPEQAYMEALQDIEADLLHASRLFEEPKVREGKKANSRRPQR